MLNQKLLDEIDSQIPIWATALLAKNELNTGLLKNYDSYRDHAPKWHQFGIHTHTRKVLRVFQSELFSLLDYSYRTAIFEFMKEEIDGLSRYHLFKVAILLHDLGKWKRSFKDLDGTMVPDYSKHEKIGKDLTLGIDNTIALNKYLHEKGFSTGQIQYIADLVGLHYELGDLRKIINISTDLFYNIALLNEEAFFIKCKEIINANPEYKREIALFFLVDNIGKVDFYIRARNDSELEQQRNRIKSELRSRNLHSHLEEAYLQTAITIRLVNKYLEFCD